MRAGRHLDDRLARTRALPGANARAAAAGPVAPAEARSADMILGVRHVAAADAQLPAALQVGSVRADRPDASDQRAAPLGDRCAASAPAQPVAPGAQAAAAAPRSAGAAPRPAGPSGILAPAGMLASSLGTVGSAERTTSRLAAQVSGTAAAGRRAGPAAAGDQSWPLVRSGCRGARRCLCWRASPPQLWRGCSRC